MKFTETYFNQIKANESVPLTPVQIHFLPKGFRGRNRMVDEFKTTHGEVYLIQLYVIFKEALATILTKKIICFGNW